MEKWNLIQTNFYFANFLKNHPSFPERKENNGKEHACYSQNIKSLSRQYRCVTCHPLRFFTKNNLRIQKVRLGVSLCVQLTSLHYFLWCPVINRGTKFAFAINALVKYTTLFFFYKNIFYKNIEAEICEILRIF